MRRWRLGSCSLLAGAARSTGPELDIQGEILPGWSVIATYTNDDVRVTKAPPPYGPAARASASGFRACRAIRRASGPPMSSKTIRR